MIKKIAAALVWGAVSLVFGVLLTEGAIRTLDLFSESRAVFQQELDEAEAPESPPEESSRSWQIHPYLGWSVRPGHGTLYIGKRIPIFGDRRSGAWTRAHRQANRFGYFSNVDDYRLVPEDHYVVGIFGGSVASNLVTIGGATLRDRIVDQSSEPDREVAVLNFASGGYKQPQQLSALMQASLLGVRFDVIINLDGYNEVVFGAANAKRRHHPIFPSIKHYGLRLDLARDSIAPLQREKLGAMHRERRLAGETRSRAAAAPALLRQSQLYRVVVGVKMRRHLRRATELESQAQEMTALEGSETPIAELPDPCLGKRDGCWQLIADIWERGSLTMDRLARGMGAQYLHVLQPSQYIEGSKPLSQVELRYAYKDDQVARNLRSGYAHLRQRGQQLRNHGVEFHDLTMVFADYDKTLYRDSCCHLNARGNEILAAAVAELLDGATRP